MVAVAVPLPINIISMVLSNVCVLLINANKSINQHLLRYGDRDSNAFVPLAV